MNKFLRAYLECALWLSTDEEGQPLDDVNSINDISEQTYSEAEADCADFIADNDKDINGKYSQAGHDFWLTRNHYGAGFWDGNWPKAAGQRMTLASQAFGMVDLYEYNGEIYS